MAPLEPAKSSQRGVSRRDFLRVGGLGVVSLSVADQAVRGCDTPAERACILLLMTGGPSPFETFDPKPEAPSHIRGPLKPIGTSVPGVAFSEAFPQLAQRADKLAVIRSLYHDAAPIHETGLQLLQTGRLANGTRFPAFGSVVAERLGPVTGREGEIPGYVVVPSPLSDTGLRAWRGQGSGSLGDAFEPLVAEVEGVGRCGRDPEARRPFVPLLDEPPAVLHHYGDTRFGRLCLAARRLVEAGVRCITVNLFDQLCGTPTWDAHGRGPDGPATLYDYRDWLGPQFDQALSALLDDLENRGLLQTTLVIAAGEMGRSSRINACAGRDHNTNTWCALMAGGGVAGGSVIGKSDPTGEYPVERPVHVAELVATVYDFFGIRADDPLHIGPSQTLPLCEHPPIPELGFAVLA